VTRRNVAVIEAIAVAGDGGRWRLGSPAVGWFRPSVARGDLVRAGGSIGELAVLGRSSQVLAAHGGIAVDVGEARGVGYGEVLVVVDPSLAASGDVAATVTTAAVSTVDGGLVFVAPTSGRFYGRPGPGKPPFVSVGDVIAAGHTICMLEVMKTFDRVTYGGAGVPARARVVEVLVADETDVEVGTPLLRIEAM
jgi:acetyl-CoA carboxylase biotin carboxyl carrier protein